MRIVGLMAKGCLWILVAAVSVAAPATADTGDPGGTGGVAGTDVNPMKPGGVAFNGGAYGNGCSPAARPDVGDLSGARCGARRAGVGTGGATGAAPAAPLPGPAARPPPRVPTPVEIATGLAPTVPLAGLTAHTSPPADRKQVTGFPVWLWLDGWAPRTVRHGGVTVTATPVSSTWDLVDAATSCAGPGEPYRSSVADPSRASTCSVTFTHSSRHTRTGTYPGHVTVTWHLAWTGPRRSGGVLPARASRLPVTLTVVGLHAATD